ncbi:MAG: hypothetical protein STSR0008_20690 [Ignavibacterium sp.]
MKFKTLTIILILSFSLKAESWIRINQLGYEPDKIKIAVFISEDNLSLNDFEICNAINEKIIYSSKKIINTGRWQKFNSTFRLNFTDFNKEGIYFIKAGNFRSPIFKIQKRIYNGTADFLLQYIRQQQCGYNPFLKDSCHTNDGFIIYNSKKENERLDVVGGWHDASDYLRYVTTSATTVFHLLFAYYKNPKAFDDNYDKNGDAGSDGIPDVLNAAKWGLNWLLEMNPSKNEMYNQVADDRDHQGFKLPNEDTISYGKNLERPIYYITGEPQGLFNFKNSTKGASSTAAKFASTFAFASKIFQTIDSNFSKELKLKSIEDYEFAKSKLGVCQTAPCRSPYFYEEENYVDDMELAASVLNLLENNYSFFYDGINYGKEEKITPWIGKDTAKHYQWYPFINLGHYFLAISNNKKESKEFINYYKDGLNLICNKANSNPFKIGIPFIWCSNNLISNILTQFRLYNELTDDKKFLELEASHFDWLFGCNPWGTSMVVGLPEWGDYPEDAHSAFSAIYNYKINGGLVDGPVYSSIYKNLIGITLHSFDEYEKFQTDYIVYHDDYGDYSTNEPTLDGTASLLMYLSFLHNNEVQKKIKKEIYDQSGIIRFDTTKSEIYLFFSGNEFGEGLDFIIDILKKHLIKGNFFFTGDFLRNKKFERTIKLLIKEEHYIGPHSDKHLLYCSWDKRDSLLITKENFLNDLKNNLKEYERFGIELKSIKYFLLPFEWYNEKISEWTKSIGLQLINYTPNTFTNADYTTPDMKNYKSSDDIITNLFTKHKSNSNKLNGCILLIHIGTDDKRTDKLYLRLDELINKLINEGYKFNKIK